MSFKHKLSRRLAMSWARPIALGTIAILACTPADQPLAPDQPSLAVSSQPGTVSDLAVAAATDTSVTLQFTEVDDGTGTPASYNVRLAVAPISWGSATDVSQGTCGTPMAGTVIGAARSCTVLGLTPGTTYELQLVAFRGTLNVDAVFGGLSNIAQATTGQGTTSAGGDTVFADGFESGTLAAWQDGVDPTRHRVVSDPSLAHSGTDVLEVTYPAGSDGGWLTRFFMPGYDSLYVSYWVRFPATWVGGTKLIAFYGSRTDNQWSAFGQAGNCPTGTDFFAAMVTTRETGNPGPTQFYTYFPGMTASNGVCWGNFGAGTTSYVSPTELSTGDWHHVELWVKLNAPTQANAYQTFWLDGVQRGTSSGFQYRTSTILRLNSVQLTFSNSQTTQQTQQLYVDDIAVLTYRPGTIPTTPVTNPSQVTDLTVSSVGDTSATLSFTEVNDGTGRPANYDIRFAAGTISWGSAASVTQGSCRAPVLGTSIGAKQRCKVYGLNPATSYQFQMVAFRDTLNVNAVFGALSNVASRTTKPKAVASVTVSPATATIAAGATQQFTATLKDNRGNILTGRTVTWASSNTGVATVSGSGLASGVTAGTASISATSGGVKGTAGLTVTTSAPAPVASVTVSPASNNLLLGATQQLTATLKDANGNILTGRTVTWSSTAPLIAPVNGSGLVNALLAGLATITATSEGQSGTAGVSVTSSGGTSGLNEPAGFHMLNDQPWNALTGNGWNYLRRASAKDASIILDATAPRSPSNVLQMVYTAGCCTDAEPSVHWMSVPGSQQVYTSWWMKLSNNWIPNPAGGGKITFLWTTPDGNGQVYTNLYHQGGDEVTGWIQGPPYRLGINTEWSPYGQKIWLPNVATTFINNGEWHHIEVYYRWGTSGNGILRWWVDGVLNGDYQNVSYPSGGTGFQQFEFAPTVQYAGDQERYMYIDHAYVSIP